MQRRVVKGPRMFEPSRSTAGVHAHHLIVQEQCNEIGETGFEHRLVGHTREHSPRHDRLVYQAVSVLGLGPELTSSSTQEANLVFAVGQKRAKSVEGRLCRCPL